MENNLFKAILAMDSYNRGYDGKARRPNALTEKWIMWKFKKPF